MNANNCSLQNANIKFYTENLKFHQQSVTHHGKLSHQMPFSLSREREREEKRKKEMNQQNEQCTGRERERERERELTLIEVAETADGTGVGEGVDDAVVKEIGSLSWEQEKGKETLFSKKRYKFQCTSYFIVFNGPQWTELKFTTQNLKGTGLDLEP